MAEEKEKAIEKKDQGGEELTDADLEKVAGSRGAAISAMVTCTDKATSCYAC